MGIIQNERNLNYTRQYGQHDITTKGVVKQYELTSKQEQQSFRNLITMYSSFDVPTILPIVGSEPINNENGVMYGWRLTFKYLPHTLDEEVNQRARLNKRYTEEEILKIIDCILSALMGFKLKKLLHGNVNCQNIFIDYHAIDQPDPAAHINNQDENKKIYSIGLPLLLNSNEEQTIITKKQQSLRYLSPLNLLQISEGRNRLIIGQKNDVFALGILLIRLMLLYNIRELYDYQNLKIKQDLLSRKLFECRQYYSAQLCQIVANMTEKQENLRPDFQEIFNYCFNMTQPDQNQIQNSNQATPTKELTQCEPLFQPASLNNSKQKNKPYDLFDRKQKLQPLPVMFVSSAQLTGSYHKSKQCEIAWKKFRNRVINKNANTPRNESNY